MNIEGMWAAYFGDVGNNQVNSGVAVLEAGRLFGGDSMMAYLGNYRFKNDQVAAEFRVWAYNPYLQVTTAFGKTGTPDGSRVILEGKLNSDMSIDGRLFEIENPSAKIPIKLVKVSDLPR
jgi:hypothetical protein